MFSRSRYLSLPSFILFTVLALIRCVAPSEIKFIRAPLKQLGEVRQFVGHDEGVQCLAISKDGKKLLSGCGGASVVNGKPRKVADLSIRLWDVETGKQLLKMEGHTTPVDSVAFAPDGNTAVSGGYDGIRLWDLKTGRETRSITDQVTTPHSIGFFADGKRFHATGVDSTVRIWDVDTGKELRRLGPQIRMLQSAALSSDERHIIAGGTWMQVWRWDVSDGKLLNTYDIQKDITGLAFAPSNKQFLLCSRTETKLIDIETGSTVRNFVGHSKYEVFCSQFTTDGKRFATCGRDQTLRIWDASTGKQIGIVEGFTDGLNCVVITPDDKHVIAAGGGTKPDTLDFTIRMWSLSQLTK